MEWNLHLGWNNRKIRGYFHLDWPINRIIHMEVAEPPVLRRMNLPMIPLTTCSFIGIVLLSACTDNRESNSGSTELSRERIFEKFVEPDTIHFSLPAREADGSSVETQTTELGV
jgi:hypothetical protein